MKRVLVLVLVLVFATLSVQAATGFVIEGIVLDENAVPLIGANILIEGTSKGVVSDLNGKFIIKSSTACLDLRVSFIGFETFEQKVCSQLKNEIILTQGTFLKEVVITASKGKANKYISSVCRMITHPCFTSSFIDTTSTTDIKEIQTSFLSFQVSCYPIPANDYVSINLKNNTAKLEIFDIQGQLLMTKLAIAQGVSTVYIDNLPPGTYVFKFTKGTEVQTVRVSKI